MKTTLVLHDPKKELPHNSGFVIVFCVNADGEVWHIAHVEYSAEHKLFNACDGQTKEDAKQTAIDCRFWAYPPTLKGVE